jgi:hypothetical protein
MAERGGGDAQAYVRAYQGDRGPGPIQQVGGGPEPTQIRYKHVPWGYDKRKGPGEIIQERKWRRRMLELLNKRAEEAEIQEDIKSAPEGVLMDPPFYDQWPNWNVKVAPYTDRFEPFSDPFIFDPLIEPIPRTPINPRNMRVKKEPLTLEAAKGGLANLLGEPTYAEGGRIGFRKGRSRDI